MKRHTYEGTYMDAHRYGIDANKETNRKMDTHTEVYINRRI